ncbi:hypothetical protein CPY51_28085 [Rhizobium tubonense]|uniref:Uncharacterized protein n=1 Tax=Rhizobium tubonense TaxID=484088 RepID=A0A2W4DYD2_9HYPH|nr:hypothetical protein CPY51_28085 [Rhizobium tubonense]
MPVSTSSPFRYPSYVGDLRCARHALFDGLRNVSKRAAPIVAIDSTIWSTIASSGKNSLKMVEMFGASIHGIRSS